MLAGTKGEGVASGADSGSPELSVIQPRIVPLGGVRAIPVHRTLPHREISLIGAWCFLDQFASAGEAMEVLPHPHTALQTVTWPFVGTIHHRDSLGSDRVVRPGELNLMTAGRGISHSEFSKQGEVLEGVQLWLALPTGPDLGEPQFENVSDLPVLSGPGWEATVFIGALGGAESPARVFSPLVGAEIRLEPGASAELPLEPAWEHGLLAAEGAVSLEEQVQDYFSDPATPDSPGLSQREQSRGALHSGHLAYLGLERSSLRVTAGRDGARLVLIGGEPFREPVVMFWNFIGRDHDQVAEAAADWEQDWSGGPRRFGHVAGHGQDHFPGPSIPPIRMMPRRSKHVRSTSQPRTKTT